MDERIILLSDHNWFAVYTQEQAQKIMNSHNWGDVSCRYGIYIEPQNKTLLYLDQNKKED